MSTLSLQAGSRGVKRNLSLEESRGSVGNDTVDLTGASDGSVEAAQKSEAAEAGDHSVIDVGSSPL